MRSGAIIVLVSSLAACGPSIRDSQSDLIAGDAAFILLTKESASASSEAYRAVMSAPPTPEQENDLAVLLVRDLKLDEAEKIFQEIIQSDPAIHAPYLNLSRLYFLLHMPYSHVMLALSSSRKFQDALLLQTAAGLYQQGRIEESQELYRALVQENRGTLEASIVLGRRAFEDAAYQEAEEHFQKALEIEGANGEALFSLGKIRFMARDYTRALSYLEGARKSRYNDRRLILLLARSYFETGALDRALDTLREADNSREAVSLKGTILLARHFDADLGALLTGLPDAERRELLIEWYDTDTLEDLPEIRKEFIYFY